MRRIFMAGSVLLFLAGMGIYGSTASARVPSQAATIRYTRSGYGAQLATDGRGLVEVMLSKGTAAAPARMARIDAATGRILTQFALPISKGVENIGAFAIDRKGNVYLTGSALAGLTTTPGAVQRAWSGYGPNQCEYSNFLSCTDAFVAKVGPTGKLIYSTYLGGPGGNEDGTSIAVDSTGNAYIGADTTNVFPHTRPLPGAPHDPNCIPSYPHQPCYRGILVKLNATGTKVLYGLDLGTHSSADAAAVHNGHLYVAGIAPAGFPMSQGAYRFMGAGLYLARLNLAGTTFDYATYLGGTTGGVIGGIAVGPRGDAVVTGSTTASDFPTMNAAGIPPPLFSNQCRSAPDANSLTCVHGFVVKLNARGSGAIYSTYLGGAGDDTAKSVAMDSSGNAYIVGYTASQNFPIRGGHARHGADVNGTCTFGSDYLPHCADGFLAELGNTGKLRYSSLLASNDVDLAESVALAGPGLLIGGERLHWTGSGAGESVQDKQYLWGLTLPGHQ